MREPTWAAPANLCVRRNGILQLLAEDELSILLAKAEQVPLRPRQVLHHWRSPMEYVYFVTHGLVSVDAKLDNQHYVAAWLTGSEGVVGAALVLSGQGRLLAHRRVVQVGGSALRVAATDFVELVSSLPVLRELIHRYLGGVLVQTSQSAACNASHSIKQRLARWLLTACIGLDDHKVPLTHEVLGSLLGVRRASVTECLQVLENDGMVRHTRGLICISDPQALRSCACACLRFIEREYRHSQGTLGRWTVYANSQSEQQ